MLVRLEHFGRIRTPDALALFQVSLVSGNKLISRYSNTRLISRRTWPLGSVIPELNFHKDSPSCRWLLSHENSTEMSL